MDFSCLQFLDHLHVGVSLVTWHPDDLGKLEWIFVNEARCRLTGFSREETLARPPIMTITRESRARVPEAFQQVAECGHASCEVTLLHRSNRAIPILVDFTLLPWEGGQALLSEIHDISQFKVTEEKLKLSRESTREMLSLIEREKQQITENIQGNLEKVLFPLMDQMRINADGGQKEILDLMTTRIGKVCQQEGILLRSGGSLGNLTKRQILICEMIRDGMTSKEIALALGCSPSTVNNHRDTIRRKLGLSGKGANLQAWLNDSPRGG